MLEYLVDAFSGSGAAFMYAIAAVGAYTVAVSMERAFWLYLKWRVHESTLMEALMTGRRDDAQRLVKGTPLEAVIRVGLDCDNVDLAWEAMGAEAIQSERAIEARVSSLSTAGNLATMMGLLGTVYGLIIAFSALGDTASVERAASLSEGISTAMSTTGFGLVVGIASLTAHAILEGRVRSLVGCMETAAGRIAVALRQGPTA